jgi:two-component system, cell cycle sensor histidine kinase and response regulator CckA
MVQEIHDGGGGTAISAEAEHLLADVIEFLPDATFVIDAEKRVIAWNRACESLTGVKKETLLGRGDYAYSEPFYGVRRPILIDLLSREDADLETNYDFVRRKDGVVYAETFAPRLREGKGAYLWGEASWLFDRQGHRCGAIECIRDVTERKQAEEELRQREAMIRSVLRAAPVGICIMKDRHYQSANRYWCEEFGYPEESLLGKSTRLHYDSDEEWQRVGQALYANLAQKGQASARTRMRRSDGVLREVIVTAAPIESDDPSGATVAIIHDITEQVQAETDLRFRNAILLTQQETSMDGILVVDDHGKIVSSNRKFAQMWRMPLEIVESGSDERALAWAITQVKAPDEFIRVVRELYTHPERSSEDEIAMSDGRTFERHSAPMVAGDGQCLGRVWYFRDISERKRAEVARDRAEEQLRQSQKMEAIGSLAAGVAHDFNNLLCVIMSATSFAMERLREDDAMMDDLREVSCAADRAAALTRQLLAFGRKQMMHLVPLDLNAVAKGLENMLRRILGEDIEIVFRLAQDLGLVRADEGQIEQVLMNLVVNARDAMANGGRLTIETDMVNIADDGSTALEGMPPGEYVQLTATDTGCGMDEQTRSKLFEPFFTTKKKGKGTGLGLSTVYGIVKQSGGDILVSSEPNRGSTFRIRLPRELSLTPGAAPEPSCSPRLGTGTETILVVEDEYALRLVVRRALAEAGYTVLLAANGDEAVGLCETYTGDIHLLLTDVVMPGMSGSALARELLKTRPTLAVLYVSGYVDNMLDQRAELSTEVHFLGKPFTGADIKCKVREVLDRRRP